MADIAQIVRAFALGVFEFRREFTTHFGGDLIETYDRGRELAHRFSLRRFEPDPYHARDCAEVAH